MMETPVVETKNGIGRLTQALLSHFRHSPETPANSEAISQPEKADELFLEREQISSSKAYFHTFNRNEFQPDAGILSSDRHENVTDFSSWSIFFPYEKIGNYWGEVPRKIVSFKDHDGRPNFSLMVLDEKSPVLKVTDRYKRAFVANQSIPRENLQQLAENGIKVTEKTRTIGPELFLAKIPITRELMIARLNT